MCSTESFRMWAEEINNVDIMSVCDELGVEVRRGSILCPDPGHNDAHFGSCKLYRNRYKCFACGASGSVVDLVKNTLTCSWRDAADFIASNNGLPSYKDAVKGEKDAEDKPKIVPLTRVFSKEQLKYLGLRTESSRVYTITGVSDGKPEDERSIVPGLGFGYEYVTGTSTLISLQMLWEEDQEAVEEMIKGKAKETIVRYLNLYNSDLVAEHPELRLAIRHIFDVLEPVFMRYKLTNYKLESKARYKMAI